MAFLLPVLFGLVALALNLLLGAGSPSYSQWSNWQVITGGFVIQFLFVGLGEEPGFSGAELWQLWQLWWVYTLIWVVCAAFIVWRVGFGLKGWR